MLEGLAKVLLDIDRAIRIIRETKEDAQVIPNLMSGFGIDEEQASYVAEIKLRNLNRDWILNRTKDIEKLKSEIRKLNKQISSDKEIGKIIVKTLAEIKKKYGKERKTSLVPVEEAPAVEQADLIPDYPVVIYRTKEGYIKKVAASSMKGNYEIRTKDGDEIIQALPAQNTSELIVFTDRCSVYKAHGYDLSDSRPSDLGQYAASVFGLEEGESMIHACILSKGMTVLIGFRNGKVAKFPLSVYETKQNRKKLLNAFSDKSQAAGICIVQGDAKIGIVSSRNRMLILQTKDIMEKSSRTTQGVQVVKLPAKGEVVRFAPIEEFGLETETGFGYRNLPAQGGVYDGQTKLDLS